MNVLLLADAPGSDRMMRFLMDRTESVLEERRIPGPDFCRDMDVDLVVAHGPDHGEVPDGAVRLERGFAPWGLGSRGFLWSVFLDEPTGVSLTLAREDGARLLARELVDLDPDLTLEKAEALLATRAEDLFMESWDDISDNTEGFVPLSARPPVPGEPGDMDRLAAALGPGARVADLRDLGRKWRAAPDAFRREHGLANGFAPAGDFADPEPPDGSAPERGTPVAAREAGPGDVLVNWLWINDPLTRKMFKNNDYVGWSGHVRWYARMLENPDMVLCMGEADGVRFGNVRFDRQEPGIWEISINLGPRFRGRGLGPSLLGAAMDLLAGSRPVDRLYSMAKKSNPASIGTFAKAGMPVTEPERRYPSMDLFDPETEVYMERVFTKE